MKSIIFVTIALILLQFVASTQTMAGDNILSLEECLTTAYKNSPELKSRGEMLAAEKFGLSAVRSAKLPTVNLTSEAARSDQPVMAFMSSLNREKFDIASMSNANSPDDTGWFTTRLTVNYPLASGGMIPARIKMAASSIDMAGLAIEQSRRDIQLRVTKAYLDVLLATENLKVAAAGRKAAEATLSAARSRLDAGTTVKSDLLAADVRLGELREIELNAESNLAIAKAALMFETGSPQDMDFSLDHAPMLYVPFEFDQSKMIHSAQDNRVEIRKLKLSAMQKNHEAAIARAASRPAVNSFAEYRLDGASPLTPTGGGWIAGVGVSVPLYDGGRSRKTVAANNSAGGAVERQIIFMQQSVELEVRRAAYDLATAAERIKVARAAVDQANEALRIVENRYLTGLATIVETLNLEVALTQAGMREAAALHDYALSVARLKYASGM